MWGIENPWKVFNYVYERNMQREFTFMCIINNEKWESLENRDELVALEQSIASLNVSIKNPDNPAQLRDAKLIEFSR